MYSVLVKLSFDIKSKRKWNIKSGYRPLFKIPNNNSMFSGIITLTKNEELKQGETCESIVTFLFDKTFINLKINSEIEFYEGPNLIGYAKIKEILEN